MNKMSDIIESSNQCHNQDVKINKMKLVTKARGLLLLLISSSNSEYRCSSEHVMQQQIEHKKSH